MKNLTAFIFARGGSKGVKDKNIREAGGKPLIAHAIAAGLSSDYISQVVVSTDSEKIAAVAKEYGAEILLRPAELAQDKTAEIDAWKHAIDSYPDAEIFVSLPATSPLRNAEDINNAIGRFLNKEKPCDIVFGISEACRSPYLNMVKKTDDDLIEVIIPTKAVRRQDVPPVFDVTTCVYVANVEYIKSCASLSEGRVGYVEIPKSRALDIDDEFDLYLADLMLQRPFEGNK